MDEMDDENERKTGIIKMGKFSFGLEKGREQSLIHQSGYMLTGFSIVSVMLLAAIPILLEYTKIPNKIVFLFLGFSLLFLVISLLCTIVAQWRYKSIRLDSIEPIYNLMMNAPLSDFNNWWLENLNNMNNDISNLNDRRSDWMKISTVSFGFSIITILIYLVGLLVSIMDFINSML